MSAVTERPKRTTAGMRQRNLKGEALEEDEAFWKEEHWHEDDGSDAYVDESERDDSEPYFDDSEHEDEHEDDGLSGVEELEKRNGASVSSSSPVPTRKPSSWFIVRSWNDFFHTRCSSATCKLGGAMRIAYAFIFLCDRLLWTLDLDFLLSPSQGLIPFEVGQHRVWKGHQLSILSFAPDSGTFLWTVHIMSIVHGVLLLLGIAPRVQVAAIFIILVSFQNSNTLCYDGQDGMFRIWASLFLYLPLHRFSLWTFIKKKKKNPTATKRPVDDKDTDSWPMWPFRLFQLNMVFIYTGAGWGKLFGGFNWISGNALWRVSHMNDFYGGAFNPEFIFNVLGPLKILCWSSLLVENLCWITIWPKATRIPTLMVVVGLHVGIDLAMNMHCFEWLAILGWMSFLASPASSGNETVLVKDAMSEGRNQSDKRPKKKVDWYRLLTNILLVSLLSFNWASTNAAQYLDAVTPNPFKPVLAAYNQAASWLRENCDPVAFRIGIQQGSWDMFSGMVDTRHKAFSIKTTLTDGGVIENSSPDWSEMAWWEKKRYMRPMDYIEYLSDKENVEAHKTICRVFAMEYDNVATVELSFVWREAPEAPPDDLGWWDYPARQPLAGYYEDSYYTLNVDADLHEQCGTWASANECLRNPKFMWTDCVKSCAAQGLHHPELLKVGDQLLIALDATEAVPTCAAVVKRSDRMGMYRVAVDDSRCKDLEKDWVSLFANNFHLVNKGDAAMDEVEKEL